MKANEKRLGLPSLSKNLKLFEIAQLNFAVVFQFLKAKPIFKSMSIMR